MRAYLLRRAARILPAYLLVVVVVFTVLPAARDRVAELPLYPVFAQTLAPGHLVAGLTQTWSLPPEVCFYLLLPVFVALLARALPADGSLRREVLPIAVVAALGPLWLLGVAGAGWLAGTGALLWFPSFTAWFAAGMVLAVLGARRAVPVTSTADPWWRVLAAAPAACWVGAGALLVVAATPVAGSLVPGPAPDGAAAVLTKNLLYTAIACLVVAPLVLGSDGAGPIGRLLASRPARALGRWSYSVFLWHLLVIELVLRATGTTEFTGHFWLVLVLTGVVSVTVSAASWRLVESPPLRAAHRRTAPREHGTDRDEAQQLGR